VGARDHHPDGGGDTISVFESDLATGSPVPDHAAAFDELVEQLRAEVGAVVWGLTTLVGPGDDLLMLQQRVMDTARVWAATCSARTTTRPLRR
jgi:hypothetical protein